MLRTDGVQTPTRVAQQQPRAIGEISSPSVLMTLLALPVFKPSCTKIQALYSRHVSVDARSIRSAYPSPPGYCRAEGQAATRPPPLT